MQWTTVCCTINTETNLFGVCVFFPLLWSLWGSLDWGLVTRKPWDQHSAFGVDNWSFDLERETNRRYSSSVGCGFYLSTVRMDWHWQFLEKMARIHRSYTKESKAWLLPWKLWFPWKGTSWSEHPGSSRHVSLLCWSPVQMGGMMMTVNQDFEQRSFFKAVNTNISSLKLPKLVNIEKFSALAQHWNNLKNCWPHYSLENRHIIFDQNISRLYCD